MLVVEVLSLRRVQGEAASRARWARHATGDVALVDSTAMEELGDCELWTTPEALTALPETLMQICASWAADSTEKAVQRECGSTMLPFEMRPCEQLMASNLFCSYQRLPQHAGSHRLFFL